MLKSKFSIAYSVFIASILLTFGLVVWLQSVSPVRVAEAVGLIDDSLADFEFGSGCFVTQSHSDTLEDGAVIVSPTVGSNFSGSVLPSGWLTNYLGTVAIGGGQLIVENGTAFAGFDAASPILYGPTRTLEFSATFMPGGGRQFAGFGTHIFDTTGPWAIFSSADGTSVQARTNNSDTIDLTSANLPGTFFGVPHLYRIDWEPLTVTYYIDGAAVVTHSVEITALMRAAFHDDDPFPYEGGGAGGSLIVDWVHMSDYAPSPCTYTSRLIDSGLDGSSFTGLSTTLVTPAGTSIAFEVITSTNNSIWGVWTPVNADGTFISSTARYLRYRATLTTTDALLTPEVRSVRVHGYGPPPTVVRVTAFSANGPDFGARGWLIGLGGAALLAGSVRVIWRRRKTIG